MPLRVNSKRPRWGYIIALLGAIVIFLSGIVYFAYGNVAVGVLGVVFAILTIWFGRKAYLTGEKKDQRMYGMIPMLIGFFVMIATGTLMAFDMAVLIGGFLITLGGVALTSGK
ncbi:MAG: hypothetical protein ACLQO7_08955 [Candidatus Bathyarchaeia archaeon]